MPRSFCRRRVIRAPQRTLQAASVLRAVAGGLIGERGAETGVEP
jgi:uncharacterized protein YcfJ